MPRRRLPNPCEIPRLGPAQLFSPHPTTAFPPSRQWMRSPRAGAVARAVAGAGSAAGCCRRGQGSPEREPRVRVGTAGDAACGERSRWRGRPGEPGVVSHPRGDTLSRVFLWLLPGMEGSWGRPGQRRGFAAAGREDGGGTGTVVLPQPCQHPRQPESDMGQGVGAGSISCPLLPAGAGGGKGQPLSPSPGPRRGCTHIST